MSSQSTASAKRRRAGLVNTPIFKSEDNQQSTNVPQPMDIKKPMSLQQVITVFDQRLLHLEKIIIEQSPESQISEGNAEINLEQLNEIQESFQTSITKCVNEFDHRYNLLANEVVELKEMLLKLQSYTLEVNKALYENKTQGLLEKKTITENKKQTKEMEEAMDEILEKAFEETQTESIEETQTESIEEIQLEYIEETAASESIEEDVFAKDSEPWDTDIIEESQTDISASPEVVNNLDETENIEIEVTEQNVSDDQEKGKKRKKKDKKSISVSLEENS